MIPPNIPSPLVWHILTYTGTPYLRELKVIIIGAATAQQMIRHIKDYKYIEALLGGIIY